MSPCTAAPRARSPRRQTIRSPLHAHLAEHCSRQLDDSEATCAEISRWRARYPALAELSRARDLPRVTTASPDAVLTALLDAHQRGSELAGAALLQQMLFKLLTITRYARVRDYTPETIYHDRAVETLMAFLSVIRTYRPRPGNNVAAELALRTLHLITADIGQHEIPCGAVGEQDDKGRLHPDLVVADIVDWDNRSGLSADFVLDWAVEQDVIGPRDRELLSAAYLSDTTDLADLARTCGMSYPALRQRLHRSISRIRTAVCAQLSIEPAKTTGRRTHIHSRRAA